MKLVAERPEFFSVKVNGQQVQAIPGEWWLDRSFGVYAIGNMGETRNQHGRDECDTNEYIRRDRTDLCDR